MSQLPPEATDPEQTELSTSQILRLYMPLALSWLFMSLEAPMVIAIVSSMPGSQLNTAAYGGVLMPLALFIEAPVIDLLTTSTTLAKCRRDYLAIRRFVLWLIAWVTVAHTVLAVTPLWGLVTDRLLSAPKDASDAARLGMMVMVPWSGLIAWRRHLHGLMIRQGGTRPVGVGTCIRMASVTIVGWGLRLLTPLPGAVLGAAALIAGVGFECLFIHVVGQRLLRESYGPTKKAESGPVLTTRRLLAFHLPLTASTAVLMLTGPAVSAALDRTSDKQLALAAWAVTSAVVSLLRGVTYALAEVVITLYHDRLSGRKLKRFCATLGGGLSVLLVLVAWSGADRWFFVHVLRTDLEVAEQAHLGFASCALVPLLSALVSYVRGVLTSFHLTLARTLAVCVSVGVMVSVLFAAVVQGRAGVVSAGIAVTASQLAELAILGFWWRRGKARLLATE